MLVGSAPSELKLGSTTVTGVRRGAGLIYDSEVAAFQKASGATQVGPILALVDYLKAESLWNYARFYPMKSAQNAGTGSTVYGLGGLTSNNMTLVNSPTWGSDGVTFDGSTQYGSSSAAAIGASDELACFLRSAPALATAADISSSVFVGIGTIRSTTPTGTAGIVFGPSTTATSGEVWSSHYTLDQDLSGTTNRIGTSALSYNAGEDHTLSFTVGDGSSLWKNKASITLDKNSNFTPSSLVGPTDIGTVSGAIYVSGYGLNSVPTAAPTAGVVSAFLVMASSAALTTTQREAITDLINAL